MISMRPVDPVLVQVYSAECDVTVNLKIIFLVLCIGTSQETGDHADQAKGLLEEDGEFGALICSW